jgi:hypothetical protein
MEAFMNQKITRESKWFWPWQDAEEEIWLGQMSKKGLHLKQVDIMAQYDFINGQPQDYVYRLDFRDSLRLKNKDEYVHLFKDAGWEYLGEMGGWQYFRKLTQAGGETEIFTDPDTKIQKYKRYLTYLGLFYASDVACFITLLVLSPTWFLWLFTVIFSLFTIFALITWIKITNRINQLRAL